jgi:hypothetical protein
MTSRKLRTRRDVTEVKKYLAGTLAWTIALANKFQIKLDDAVYRKYPNYCFRCRSRPCKCFRLTTLFISYTDDTEEEMKLVKNLAEELCLKVETFESLKPRLNRMRMVEAFNAINRSDGAVVLFKSHWSANVWAELIEALNTMDNDSIWICAWKIKEVKDSNLRLAIKDIEHFHKLIYYSDADKLLKCLKQAVTTRIVELQKLEVKHR